jgi:hypothetical protein
MARLALARRRKVFSGASWSGTFAPAVHALHRLTAFFRAAFAASSGGGSSFYTAGVRSDRLLLFCDGRGCLLKNFSMHSA